MRQALTFTFVVLLALAGGCNQNQDQKASVATDNQPRAEAAQAQASSGSELTPEQLGELGAQIRKEPDRAEALLTEHHLTRESFEAQIRKVTEDADASKRYAEAYRKASA